MPTFVNGGRSDCRSDCSLSFGKSAIFCSPSFPLYRLQTTQEERIFLAAAFALVVLLLSWVKSTAGQRSLYFFSLLTQQLQRLSQLEKPRNWDLKPFPRGEVGYQLIYCILWVFIRDVICCIWCIINDDSINCNFSSNLWVITADGSWIQDVKRPFLFTLGKKLWAMDPSASSEKVFNFHPTRGLISWVPFCVNVPPLWDVCGFSYSREPIGNKGVKALCFVPDVL